MTFIVRFRRGGRATMPQNGGSFRTVREARIRRDLIAGLLAAGQVPDLRLLEDDTAKPQLREVAMNWQASRLDVSDGTAATHRVNLGRILESLGDQPVDEVAAADVAQLVAELHHRGLARETLRKTVSTLAQVFDFAAITPNPARDSKTVRLPREDREDVTPPTAEYVTAAIGLLPKAYRLPAVVLDATGMRVSELEQLRWSDVDEPGQRWRVSRATAKNRRSRWVPVPSDVFAAVVALVPREDRQLDAQVFDGFGADRCRTALARSCKAAAIPLISPHDLRHRRASIWHLGGVPAAEAAAWLGHSAQEHLKTYTHVNLSDRSEVDYRPFLTGSAQTVSDR
jgi:integrase